MSKKIVHRDIKGDNVLVNTYSGVVKISDFGTSKRLAGLCRVTETFAGTLQYMAPEVIDKGQRGYNTPADIWSFGCTVVEMATGKPPFIELGSPEAAMFKVGFYKMHPEIPSELSEKAQKFILTCFAPNPEQRTTAAKLLEHSFLNEQAKPKRPPVKSSISVPVGEFSRSISMSPEHHNNLANNPPSPATTSGASAAKSNNKLTLNTKEANDEATKGSIDGGGYDQTTPTELMEPTFESRRHSTDDSIGSPAILGITEPDFSETSDRFYLLKKDSQRRAFVVRVLKVDKSLIIDSWHRIIAKPDSLTKDHLNILMEGIRDYLPEPTNVEPLQSAISQVQSEHSMDASNFADILSLALYKFQDAVNSIIRRHKIKPHWMFALDSLVRNAVQQSVNVLHPEIAPAPLDSAIHLEPYPFEDAPTPKIMTSSPVNSTPPPQAQSLQKSLAVVQNFIKHLAFELEGASSGSSAGGSHSQPSSAKKVDAKLRQWLKELDIDEPSIRKFADEDLSLHDVLHLMTRDDLTRLNLKLGPELRIWDKIVKDRKKP